MAVGVVIRHLQGQRPVTLCVINPPEHPVNNLHDYFKSVADDEIRRFKDDFIEFKDAEFYLDVVVRTR